MRIGNDIVDFSHEEELNKHENQRFLARAFTQEEIQMISSAENKAQTLWMLWSAKEAAFKACQKQDTKIIFSPKQFQVKTISLKTNFTGILQYHDTRLELTWTLPSTNVIHCCAILRNGSYGSKVHELIKKINLPNATYTDLSKSVREEFIHFLQAEIKIGNPLNIVRPEIGIDDRLKKGPPILRNGTHTVNNCDISLSHDKEWIAGVLLET